MWSCLTLRPSCTVVKPPVQGALLWCVCPVSQPHSERSLLITRVVLWPDARFCKAPLGVVRMSGEAGVCDFAFLLPVAGSLLTGATAKRPRDETSRLVRNSARLVPGRTPSFSCGPSPLQMLRYFWTGCQCCGCQGDVSPLVLDRVPWLHFTHVWVRVRISFLALFICRGTWA